MSDINNKLREEYGIATGDRVEHVRDSTWIGTVINIDTNLPDITTCNIKWDDCDDVDIQWTNKLILHV